MHQSFISCLFYLLLPQFDLIKLNLKKWPTNLSATLTVTFAVITKCVWTHQSETFSRTFMNSSFEIQFDQDQSLRLSLLSRTEMIERCRSRNHEKRNTTPCIFANSKCISSNNAESAVFQSSLSKVVDAISHTQNLYLLDYLLRHFWRILSHFKLYPKNQTVSDVSPPK